MPQTPLNHSTPYQDSSIDRDLSIDQPKKHQLRQQFRHLRRSLDRDRLSQTICQQLAQSYLVKNASGILAYWATEEEVNLHPLMEQYPDKTWGLPRMLPKGQLAWHHHRVGIDSLVPANYGIQEPSREAPLIPLETVDLMLVPALACDRQGTRLGYGGGYYDRCLSQPPLQDCFTICVVPKDCFTDVPLPRDPWDCGMKAIATEHGVDPY